MGPKINLRNPGIDLGAVLNRAAKKATGGSKSAKVSSSANPARNPVEATVNEGFKPAFEKREFIPSTLGAEARAKRTPLPGVPDFTDIAAKQGSAARTKQASPAVKVQAEEMPSYTASPKPRKPKTFTEKMINARMNQDDVFMDDIRYGREEIARIRAETDGFESSQPDLVRQANQLESMLNYFEKEGLVLPDKVAKSAPPPPASLGVLGKDGKPIPPPPGAGSAPIAPPAVKAQEFNPNFSDESKASIEILRGKNNVRPAGPYSSLPDYENGAPVISRGQRKESASNPFDPSQVRKYSDDDVDAIGSAFGNMHMDVARANMGDETVDLSRYYGGSSPKTQGSSTEAINPVSSGKAGYEGIGATGGGSGADLLATYGASAGLGAAVTTISEGEITPSGLARGAMFGIGGGMALRGVGASLGTGTLNAIGRASGNRLSQMENEFASDAGKQIVKGLDAMSSSASAQTQAARMATLAGAGLTGFAMSRDRNHSRGLNSTRGSRF